VRHAKDPAAKIAARPIQLQVAEEREKNLLHDVFAVRRSQPKREHIAKDPAAIQVEEGDDFIFEWRSGIGGCCVFVRRRQAEPNRNFR